MRSFLQKRLHTGLLLCCLYSAPVISAPVELPAPAAEITIKGTVTDANGPLPGVTVQVAGAATGVTTNAEGFYTIKAPDNGTLIFSFIGYTTSRVPVNNRERIDVVMAFEAKSLQDIVVVGYGSQKRGSVTGSLGTVKGSEISDRAVTGIGQALQGKVSGVQVTRSSGAPGAGADVRIRGVGTLNSGQGPLVVVDGVEGRDLNTISPKDIESITVLKDASASAIYGSRAANGVVVITTRKGATGKARVDYSYSVGLGEIVKMPRLLNAKDYARLQNEALINSNKAPTWTDEQIAAFGEGTNWLAAILQTGIRQEHNLTVSGGNEKVRYLLSSNILDDKGIIKYSWFKRITGRMNLDAQVNDRINVGVNAYFFYSKSQDGPGLHQAIEFSPTIPLYNPDGTPGYRNPDGAADSESGGLNPLQTTEIELGYSNNSPVRGTNSSVYAEVKILPSLKFRTTGALDISYTLAKTFLPSYRVEDPKGKVVAERLPKDRRLDESYDYDQKWLVNNVLTYTQSFGDHNLVVTAGHSEQYGFSEEFSSQRTGFPSNNWLELDAGSNLLDQVSGSKSEFALRSFFGRINYDYKQKYLLELVARYDGSSRFSPKRKYGFFPSASVGWRVSDEAFFDPLKKTVNDLKLRISYGALGNEAIPNFGYLQNLSWNDYAFSNTYVQGASFDGLVNPEIRWETTQLANIGLDLSMFNNAMTLTVDAYRKITRDILTPIQLPATTGHSAGDVNPGTQFRNVGKVRNAGVEMLLTYNSKPGRDWYYSLSLSGSYNRNKILSLGNSQLIFSSGGRNVEKVGYPMNSIYGWQAIGVWQNQDEINKNPHQANDQPGDLRLADLNGDGIVDGADREPLGSAVPVYTMGLNGDLKYKNFDFNFSTQGDFKRKILRYAVGGYFELAYTTRNNFDYILNRWHGEGTSNKLPRVVNSEYNTGEATSLRVQDADYFKIRHVELGYTLPMQLMERAGISNLRIYVAVENAYTFSSFVGLDPERPGSVQRQNETYPQARTYLLGLNLSF